MSDDDSIYFHVLRCMSNAAKRAPADALAAAPATIITQTNAADWSDDDDKPIVPRKRLAASTVAKTAASTMAKTDGAKAKTDGDDSDDEPIRAKKPAVGVARGVVVGEAELQLLEAKFGFRYHKTPEVIDRLLTRMAKLRADPAYCRKVRLMVVDYHLCMSYMYLNMHKYPQFYSYLVKQLRQLKNTRMRLVRRSPTADSKNISRDLSTYETFGGLHYWLSELQQSDADNKFYRTLNVVFYGLKMFHRLLVVPDFAGFPQFPNITTSVIRGFIYEQVFRPILNDGALTCAAFIDTSMDLGELRKTMLDCIVQYASEELGDEMDGRNLDTGTDKKRARTIRALHNLSRTIMSIKKPALCDRIFKLEERNILAHFDEDRRKRKLGGEVGDSENMTDHDNDSDERL